MNKIFIVTCRCGSIIAAHSIDDCYAKEIGESVDMAATKGCAIAIVDAPALVKPCQCFEECRAALAAVKGTQP